MTNDAHLDDGRTLDVRSKPNPRNDPTQDAIATYEKRRAGMRSQGSSPLRLAGTYNPMGPSFFSVAPMARRHEMSFVIASWS